MLGICDLNVCPFIELKPIYPINYCCECCFFSFVSERISIVMHRIPRNRRLQSIEKQIISSKNGFWAQFRSEIHSSILRSSEQTQTWTIPQTITEYKQCIRTMIHLLSIYDLLTQFDNLFNPICRKESSAHRIDRKLLILFCHYSIACDDTLFITIMITLALGTFLLGQIEI